MGLVTIDDPDAEEVEFTEGAATSLIFLGCHTRTVHLDVGGAGVD